MSSDDNARASGQPPPPYPPPPPPPPPPTWGATPPPWYPSAPPPQTEGKAIAALVCAIASFVILPVVPAIVAVVLASSARKDIAASGGRLTGDSLAVTSLVIAWINIGLLALAAVLAFVVLALGAKA